MNAKTRLETADTSTIDADKLARLPLFVCPPPIISSATPGTAARAILRVIRHTLHARFTRHGATPPSTMLPSLSLVGLSKPPKTITRQARNALLASGSPCPWSIPVPAHGFYPRSHTIGTVIMFRAGKTSPFTMTPAS